MRVRVYILFVSSVIFLFGWAGPGQTQEAGTESKRIKHEQSWWRGRPDRETPESQLAYADSLKNAGSIRKATSEYRVLVYTWPESPQAPVAQLNYAQLLAQRGKLIKAFDEYQFLIETYPGFFPFQEALERQYEIADKIATGHRYFLLFRYKTPEDAIPLFEKMIQSGPQWKKASELQFRIARIYEKTEQYDLAVDAYALYHQRYPMGPLAEQSFFGQAKCCYLYSRKHHNAADLRENAIATLKGFLDWYSKSDMAPQARRYLNELEADSAMLLYQQAQVYLKASHSADDQAETKKCLTGAKVSFQRLIYEFPNSRWADTAKAQIRQIDEQLEKIK
ncbi:MAG: tetratricopeptide repeat protein [Kiritimatiellia bacterium]|nr:tetratricopeptide repeat protein [Kiritimatiellia bacterium]